MINTKSEMLNSKQAQNPNISNLKQYDLESRTLAFAIRVRQLIRALPLSTCNIEDGKQLVRSSGSIGANYIEANEALSKKDFIMRIKISRKEAKETIYWLNLLDVKTILEVDKQGLIKEATELMKIFGAILMKTGS